jgi:hypothetical protein
MAELHYSEAIKHVKAAREPRLKMLYEATPAVLQLASQMYQKDPDGAINLITQFAGSSATAWQRDWLTLGNTLLAKYAMGMVDGQTVGYPEWWNEVVGFKPLVR